MMKALEDVFTGRNGAACVPNLQHNVPAPAAAGRADSNQPTGPIVLACVLKEILHNEGVYRSSPATNKPAVNSFSIFTSGESGSALRSSSHSSTSWLRFT